MALNSISDGQPFTYQLLNTIIEEILDLKKALGKKNGDNEDEGGLVEVAGPDLGSKYKPLIIFDRISITIPENQTGVTEERSFRTSFNNDNPILVATIVDKEVGGNVPIGYLTITDVKKNKFSLRIKLIKSRNKPTVVQVNYIAMGQASK